MVVLTESAKKIGDNFYCEQMVLVDGEDGYKFVVSSDCGFWTFDSSFFDFKDGTGKKPNAIEEFNLDTVELGKDFAGDSPFAEAYRQGTVLVERLGRAEELVLNKYKQIKKPNQSGAFHFISKSRGFTHASGKDFVYEIEFKTLEGRRLYVSAIFDPYTSLASGLYLVSGEDCVDIYSKNEETACFSKDDKDVTSNSLAVKPLETYNGFLETVNSDYYEMFYELELYIDECKYGVFVTDWESLSNYGKYYIQEN